MTAGPEEQDAVLGLRVARVVLVAIIVATAIPARLGPPSINLWRWVTSDVFANVLLYIPLGVTLRRDSGILHAVTVAAGLSTAIEVAQSFYVNRISNPIDVAANVLGTTMGVLIARRLSHLPKEIRLSKTRGAVLLALAVAWVLSTRTFVMYVVGFGWFANKQSPPPFWSLLPHTVIHAGVEIHQLGVIANTAIAGLLSAAGVIGLLQPSHPYLRASAGASAGVLVGTVIMPHLNIFPLLYCLTGTAAGLALSACTLDPAARGTIAMPFSRCFWNSARSSVKE